MITEFPADVQDAVARVRSLGGFPVLVASTDPELPFVVFQRPTIAELSSYVAKASDAAIGPLLAAIGLARISIRFPDPPVVSAIETQRPFVIMRCVQALLADLGLTAKAQKKSL